jgi:hypothetical protein
MTIIVMTKEKPMRQKIDVGLHEYVYGKGRKLGCKGWWAFRAGTREGITETYLCPTWTYFRDAAKLAKEHFPDSEIIRLMPFYD